MKHVEQESRRDRKKNGGGGGSHSVGTASGFVGEDEQVLEEDGRRLHDSANVLEAAELRTSKYLQ